MKQSIIPHIIVYLAVFASIVFGVAAIDGVPVLNWVAASPLLAGAYSLFSLGVAMSVRKIAFRLGLKSRLNKFGAEKHFVFPIKLNYVFNFNSIGLLCSVLILAASLLGERINVGYSLLLLITAFIPMTKVIFRAGDRRYYMDDVRLVTMYVAEIADQRKNNYILLTLLCGEQKEKRVNFPIPPIYMRVVNDL